MRKPHLLLFLLGLLSMSCADTPTTPPPFSPEGGYAIRLVADMDRLLIRQAPQLDADTLGAMAFGTQLPYAGGVTDFTQKIKLRGVWYDEPWVAVKTPTGDTGWVFGGGVHFDGEESEQISETFTGNRLHTFFGNLADSINIYRDRYAAAATSEEFAGVYHWGEALRDSIVGRLRTNIPPTEAEELPDLFWLERLFPGYVVEMVAEGTEYYLFKDFGQLHTKARQTEGEEDDIFTDLGLAVYSEDSIEYFHPAWFLQTWDYGGHSLLGDGKHNDVLALADEITSMTTLFKDDISKFKSDLLWDITNPETTYWNDRGKILTELEDIAEADYGILSSQDRQALKARRKQFEQPDSTVQTNARTGQM